MCRPSPFAAAAFTLAGFKDAGEFGIALRAFAG